jgi:two-component system sensor histidine kinase FlrB
MGEMAAQLAHQLRTPLAAALLYAGQPGEPEPAGGRGCRSRRRPWRGCKHLERLIQDMLMFARGEVLGRETIRGGRTAGGTGADLRAAGRRRGIAFHVTDDSAGGALTGHRKSLAGALTNLLENALQAVDDSGRIDLDARRDGALLLLSVRDNGRGMNAETAARLFEPFFTTRAEGTGLGLAIARGVARAHGGGIEVTQPRRRRRVHTYLAMSRIPEN